MDIKTYAIEYNSDRTDGVASLRGHSSQPGSSDYMQVEIRFNGDPHITDVRRLVNRMVQTILTSDHIKVLTKKEVFDGN